MLDQRYFFGCQSKKGVTNLLLDVLNFSDLRSQKAI